MRIAIAGVVHETNTYAKGYTVTTDFHIARASKMLSVAGQESDLGGAVDACTEFGYEAVPILYAQAQPSGTIEFETYDLFKAEILDRLAQAHAELPIDACVLLLHGAGVVDGIADLEGDLAAAVREQLPTIAMAASFDLHANLTQHMADQLNGIFICRQYPHIDMHTAAKEAVVAVAGMVESGHRAQCTLVDLPMLMPTTTTFEGAGEDMLAQLLDIEKAADILNLSWSHGFPYTDVAHVGSYVAASYFPEQQSRALAAANAFASHLWHEKERLKPNTLNAEEAIQAATALAGQPIVINETSDNCGGGSPGDGTHLLRAMLAAKLGRQACFSFLVDPEVAALAHKAGIGATIDISLGGKTDDLHGEPLQLQAYVKALHDGQLIMQHMFRGARLKLGPMVRLVVDDMDIVVASRRSQTFDREPFIALGIDVQKYKYVALKSSNHFRAGFQHLAAGIVTADTPGLMTNHIEIFPRQNCQRPMWPLDDKAEFLSR